MEIVLPRRKKELMQLLATKRILLSMKLMPLQKARARAAAIRFRNPWQGTHVCTKCGAVMKRLQFCLESFAGRLEAFSTTGRAPGSPPVEIAHRSPKQEALRFIRQ